MRDDGFVDMSAQALEKLKLRGRNTVDAAVFILRDAIVDAMELAEPRTGHVYRVPGTNATYTASAPGEAPAVREGVYSESWQAFPAQVFGNVVVGAAFNDKRVGPSLEYPLGIILEEGSGDLLNYRVRQEPRPHIRPGMAAAAERIAQELGVR